MLSTALGNGRQFLYKLAVLPTDLGTLGIDSEAPTESLTPLFLLPQVFALSVAETFGRLPVEHSLHGFPMLSLMVVPLLPLVDMGSARRIRRCGSLGLGEVVHGRYGLTSTRTAKKRRSPIA
jgi:hypothetical protein